MKKSIRSILAVEAAGNEGSKNVKLVEKLSADSYQPVICPIGVINGARAEPAARAFVDAVLSLQGQQILGRYGFITEYSAP